MLFRSLVVTSTTPVAIEPLVKTVRVASTDSARFEAFVLPKNAVIVGAYVMGTANSGAVTSAVITVGTGGAGTLYRGVVFYVPYLSNINDFLIDTNVAITATGGTIGTVSVQIGNAFNTTTYGSVTSANASAARNTITQTGAQLLACNSTSADITNLPTQSSDPNAAWVSQVVVTFTIPYTGGTSGVLSSITEIGRAHV